MGTVKKVFVGSLFEFTKPKEVIDHLDGGAQDLSASRFISYDEGRKVFSFELDATNNQNDPIDVVHGLTSYMEFKIQQQANETQSPRLRPVLDMSFTGPSSDSQIFQPLQPFQPEFGNIIDCDSESDGGSDIPSSGVESTLYWKPKNKDIAILTDDVVEDIRHTAGSFLFPEAAEQRIKICSGHVQRAMEMLRSIEPLLELTHRHRHPALSRGNANIAVLPANGKQVAAKFVKVAESDAGFERIILPAPMKGLITTALLLEARFRRPNGQEFVKPGNLSIPEMNPVPTSSRCKLFDGHVCEIGKSINAAPQEALQPAPLPSTFTENLTAQTKYMAPSDATRVSKWSKAVDMLANPDAIPQMPQPDTALVSRRRVVEDSASDSEPETADFTLISQKKHGKQPLPLLTGRSKFHPSTTLDVSTDNKQRSNERCQTSAARDHKHDPPRRSETHVIGHATHSRSNINNPYSALDTLESESDQELASVFEVQTDTDSQVYQDAQFWGHIGFNAQASTLANVAAVASADDGHPTPSLTNKSDLLHKHDRSYFDPYVVPSVPNSPRLLRERSAAEPVSLHNCENRPSLFDTQTSDCSRQPDKQNPRDSYTSGQPSNNNQTQDGSGHVLIDVSCVNENSNPVLPPPGLDYTSISSPPAAVNLIDLDLDQIQRPAMKPIVRSETTSQANNSSESNSSRLSRLLSYTPRPVVRKRDVNHIRDQKIAEMKSQVSENAQSPPGSVVVSLSPPRLYSEAAGDTAKYHQTMSQQMANPGRSRPRFSRGKSLPQAETKKERNDRIARAKADAYGDLPPPPQPSILKRSSSASPEKGSHSASSSIGGTDTILPTLTDRHSHQIVQEQTNRMISELTVLFEACQSFSGKAEFEFQLGQALILQSGFLKDTFLYKSVDLNKIFSVNRIPAVESIFTNILTRNGAELDQLIDMKGFGNASRLWSKKSVQPAKAAFEFLCQDKTGLKFSIIMDSRGAYHIVKSKITIGKVALFFPSQVWDACANLHGDTIWKNPPFEISEGVKAFMDSVFVPPNSRAVVFFRQPANRAFQVHDVVVTRMSVHECLMLGWEDYQIKVSEIKTLIHSTHPTDRSLYRSCEGDDDEMIDTQRLHYEASLTNKRITDHLAAQNSNTNIKGLPTKALLSSERIYRLIELTTHIIQEADWLGSSNYGTYRQLLDEAELAQAEVEANIPPHIATRVGTSMKTLTTSVKELGSTSRDRRHAAPTQSFESVSVFSNSPEHRPIRGIRVGETAPLFKQGDQYFRLGIGGARVPVRETELVSGSRKVSDSIMPGDSASLAEDTMEKTGTIAGRRGVFEKPEGFW